MGDSGASHASLAALIGGISGAVVCAQTALDRHHALEDQHWLEAYNSIPPENAVVRQLAEDIRPAAQQIVELSASLSLEMEQGVSTTAGIGLNLFGRPLTTFFERRFGRRHEHACQLEIRCSATAPRRVNSKSAAANPGDGNGG